MAHRYPGAASIAIVLAVAVAAPIDAGAQTARSSSGGAASQAARQVQQLAEERTALQAENAALRKELEQLKSKLSGTNSEHVALRQRAAGADAAAEAARAARADLETEIARRRTREEEIVAEFRKTIATLREVEADRARLAGETRVTSADLKRCTEANVELADIALDVLVRYEGAGLGHALARAEPFTRLARTRVENLVDEYRQQVETLRTAPPPAAPSPP